MKRSYLWIPALALLFLVACSAPAGDAAGWIYRHQRQLAALSVTTFVLALIALPMVLGRLPEDYFVRRRRQPMRREDRHPMAWGVLSVLKNLAGIALILAGVAMLVLPGQGTLTILLGLGLTNFPGKYALERRILGLSVVRSSLDRIRRQIGQPPFRWNSESDAAERTSERKTRE